MNTERLIELYVDAQDLDPLDCAIARRMILDFLSFIRVTGSYLTSGPSLN